MNSHILLDTGVLVALLNRRDQHHCWAKEIAARFPPPWYICEPVITESFYLLNRLPDAVQAILKMLRQELLLIAVRVDAEAEHVAALMHRYANAPMSLADACLVRMSELIDDCKLLTLDGDFRVYRRHGRKSIPLLIPSGL